MRETIRLAHAPAVSPLSTPTTWERWVQALFVWMPYATLAGSLTLAQLASRDLSSRALTVGISLAAAGWTWVTFTRAGPPQHTGQRTVRFYFAGFLVAAGLLIFREQVFLVYGVTGFFHAALLRPWSLAFTGVGLTSFLVHLHIVAAEGSLVNWAIYLGVVVIQTVAVGAGVYAGEKMTEIAENRRQMVAQLELALKENAGLHEQLMAQAREAGVLDERQRMAREIHDTIAQGLAGVITQIEAAHQSRSNESEMRRHLDNAAELARDSLAEARRSVQAIQPASLAGSRLPQALAEVVSRWSEVTGVPATAHATGDRRVLRPEVEVTLLRAAQEGLANIEKHSKASRAGVTLSYMEDSVTLDIRDDGVGFDMSSGPRAASFGLVAMRQRVASIQGKVLIESAPGEGATISVTVPTAAATVPVT